MFLSYMKGERNWLQEVTDLNISCMDGFEDNIADDILQLLPKLKVLDVSRSRITGCFIKALADARTSRDGTTASVDRLIIKDCEAISSDAVAYGRAKGMEIVR